MTEDDDRFARAAGELLRRSAGDIDAATGARLQQIRRAALGATPARRDPRSWLVPALSAAAIGALAVGLWLDRDAAPEPAGLAADNLEMLEDLEFYAWLDAEPGEAGPGG